MQWRCSRVLLLLLWSVERVAGKSDHGAIRCCCLFEQSKAARWIEQQLSMAVDSGKQHYRYRHSSLPFSSITPRFSFLLHGAGMLLHVRQPGELICRLRSIILPCCPRRLFSLARARASGCTAIPSIDAVSLLRLAPRMQSNAIATRSLRTDVLLAHPAALAFVASRLPLLLPRFPPAWLACPSPVLSTAALASLRVFQLTTMPIALYMHTIRASRRSRTRRQHAATHPLLHTAGSGQLPLVLVPRRCLSSALCMLLMLGQHRTACYAFASHLLSRTDNVVEQLIVLSCRSLRLLSLQSSLQLGSLLFVLTLFPVT